VLKRSINSNRTLRYSNRAVPLFHVEHYYKNNGTLFGEILERIIGKILSIIGSSLVNMDNFHHTIKPFMPATTKATLFAVSKN